MKYEIAPKLKHKREKKVSTLFTTISCFFSYYYFHVTFFCISIN